MSSSILNLNYTIKLRSILMKKWLQFITSEQEGRKSPGVCVCVWGGGGCGTPIHYLYGYVPPNVVVILKLLIQNGVSISEAFSRTGYNISNARKLQFCQQPFEIIQGQIAFTNMVQCVNKQTFVLSCTLERSIKNWSISRTGFQFQGTFFLERGTNLESWAAHTHPKNTQVPPPPPPQGKSEQSKYRQVQSCMLQLSSSRMLCFNTTTKKKFTLKYLHKDYLSLNTW